MARMGDRRVVYRVLVGRPEGKRQRDHLEDNIKTGFQEVGCGRGLDSSGAVYGHLACSCECGIELSDSVKCGEFLD